MTVREHEEWCDGCGCVPHVEWGLDRLDREGYYCGDCLASPLYEYDPEGEYAVPESTVEWLAEWLASEPVGRAVQAGGDL